MRRIFVVALLAVLLAPEVCPAGTAQDACESLLPPALRDALLKRVPDYRVAHVSDYSKEEVEHEMQYHGGSRCLAVAAADIDGDGRDDFALLITNKEGHTLLMAARNVKEREWVISKLDDFGKDGPGGSYVGTVNPGLYQDLFATDDAPSEYIPEPGRVQSYKSSRSGFIAGTIESTGIAYFFTGKRWVHLWLSD